MTTTVDEILGQAATMLHDPLNKRWGPEELVDFINDGIARVVELVPTAHIVSGPVLLAAGAKQTIPAAARLLLDVPMNSDVSGSGGDAITHVDMHDMNAELPGWRTSTTAATAVHFMYDPAVPKVFYVFPPQPSTPGYVEMERSEIPARIAQDEAVPIDDNYRPALIHYIVFRAYSKDAEYAGADGEAAVQYANFEKAVAGA